MSLFPFPDYLENQRALGEVCELLAGWGAARIVVPDAMFTGILGNVMNPDKPGNDWGATCRERDEFNLFEGVTIVRRSSVKEVCDEG